MKTVNFTQMKDGTEEEYLFLRQFELEHDKAVADRVLRELGLQAEETLPGYKITRLDHALQAATRAFREATTTCAPSAASWSAISRPSPRPPPVTIATWP